MSKKEKILASALVAASLALVCVLVLNQRGGRFVAGSVQFGGESQSTTTSTGRFPTNPVALCGTTGGTLDSVIITGAAAGIINVYNATTSSVLLRASAYSTSSVLAVNLNTSAAAGSYIFGQTMPLGILLELTGTMPTSTITYRCN